MEEAKAFIDISCPKCRRRFGWYGLLVQQPPCPRCSFRAAPAELERDQAAMNDFKQLLAELREANPGWGKWQKARVAAGLTLRQAARLLEVAPTTLSEIERGQNRPSEALAARMARCYGG